MTERRIMEELYAATRKFKEWGPLASLLDNPSVGVHLAVMLDPFLSYILNGQKTIESRFSKHAIAPYMKVATGDLILLKSGPVVGSFRVSSVNYVALVSGDLERLRRNYGVAIQAEDDEFWEARVDKRYATFCGIDDVRTLRPVAVSKRDKRGWVVLRASLTNGSLNDRSLGSA